MHIIRNLDKISIRSTINQVPRKEVARILALTLFVVIVWCVIYNRTTIASWNVPLSYYGDVWCNMAKTKAYQEGELSLFSWAIIRSLNAPFSANWNDYPNSEQILPYFTGIAARFLGLMPALNLAGLMASILAAVTFYITCRYLSYQWMFAFAIAALFAFSHYMSARVTLHLNLSYYFHIPLFLMVTWWCLDSRDLPLNSARWWFAAAVGALTGLLAIYYAFLFWQFLGFAMIAQALRRNISKLKSVVSISAVSVTCTVAMAIPFETYRIVHGPNASVLQRSLSGLELFGLKLPELFLPPFHRWKALFEFSQANYYEVSRIAGEMGSPYLGLAGIIGLVWLVGLGVVRLLKGNTRAVPMMFWQTLWIIVFSLIGGVNLLLGAAGLLLFRATNRYSIVLLCLALLFLTRMLGRVCPAAHRSPLALVLLAGGLWDVLPPIVNDQQLQGMEKIVSEDRSFVQRLEENVSAGTMVFQLPVMDFPEVPPRLGVTDYSHFRPYLYSSKLRFSYGSDKGRALEAWQRDVEILPAKEMAEKLETLGFGVILINRAGFSDSAKSLLRDLDAAGRKVIENSEHRDFVAVGLRPNDHPVLPEIPPFPGPGFYGWEGDWRKGALAWSNGDATLILTNLETIPVERRYTLSFGSLSKRRVTILTPKETKRIELTPGHFATATLLPLQLASGETKIRFKTDKPPISQEPPDRRKLAFSIALIPERPKDPGPVLGPGFYGWEGDWRKGAHSWSKGSATLILTNLETKPVERQYTLSFGSLIKRRVTILTPRERKIIELHPGHSVAATLLPLQLMPGETKIQFETDKPAISPGPPDPRTLAFSIALVPERFQDPLPVLGPGFYGWEGDWRKGAHSWSQGTATLVLRNKAAQAVEKRYCFNLQSLSQRQVTIIAPNETRTVALAPGKLATIGPFIIQLQPGETSIRFETDKPAVTAGGGDTRKITFSMAIVPETEEPAN